jgi:competence ComEA-like helix-hairpin-helix protein
MQPDDSENFSTQDFSIQNLSAWNRLEWLSRILHWERILLLIVITAILGMIGSLFWPEPQATVVLKPFPVGNVREHLETQENSIVSAPLESTIEEPPGEDPSQSVQAHRQRKSSTHASYRKKPDHPPITNLNTAKPQQLQLLPGIGPKMAERILEYRKINRGFQTIEQIMDVKGIGQKKFAKMKSFLKV